METLNESEFPRNQDLHLLVLVLYHTTTLNKQAILECTVMLSRTIRNRPKIPNRVAALAAVLIVVSCIADPEQLKLADSHNSLTQQDSNSSVDETVNELVGVAVAAVKPANFNISKLIFRF